jgi:hypothetical protein
MNELLFKFFYELPVWLWSILFILFTLVFTTLFNNLIDRLKLTKTLQHEVELSTSVMQLAGTIFAVLLALIVVSVFERYSTVESVMFEEATYAGNIFRDTFVIDKKNAEDIRQKIYNYLHLVIQTELPAQKKGLEDIKKVKVYANQEVEDILSIIAKLDNKPIIQGEMLNQINQLLKYRRIRIGFTTESHLPNTIWVTLIIGSLILTVNLSLIQSEQRFHMNIFCYIYILSIDLMLILIIAYDRPFCGELSVSTAPYQQVMLTMKKRLNYSHQLMLDNKLSHG